MIRSLCFLSALALAAIFLSGCETTPQLPQRVEVPVPVPCHVTLPGAPAWATDALQKDASLWEMAKATLAELEQRRGYEQLLEAAAKACS